MVNEFLNWWRDHSLVSLVITGGALAGAIPKYIELANQGLRNVRRRATAAVDRYIPGYREWVTVTNPRYGFAFTYPCVWLREMSTRAGRTDGYIVTHPEIRGVEIRGWGGHAVVWPTPEEWINATTEKVARVVSRSEVDIELRSDSGAVSCIEGDRLVFDEGENRVVHVFAQIYERQVGLRCSAPRKFFPRLESVFLTACNSLSLTCDWADTTDEGHHRNEEW